MNAQVSILHDDYPSSVKDSVREMVEDRLQGLDRFFDRTKSVRALLERERASHRVEIVCNVGRGSVLVADVRGDRLNPTVDEAIQRMTVQLKRHHDKLTRERRRGGRIGH